MDEPGAGTTNLPQSERWRASLLEGHGAFERRVYRVFPQGPRCAICYAPFHGFGGRLFSVFGFRPSRKNPRFCNWCFERGPHGGAELDAGIFFADLRGYTSFSESRTPQEVAEFLNRFYRLASDILVGNGAIIDKLVGDEVMAIFVPGFAGPDYASRMVGAAADVLAGAGFAPGDKGWMPVGIGLDHGPAFVGNIGVGEVKDFTAIGDVVNTAARLQAQAKPGQIVMSERMYEYAADRFPDAQRVELELRGKSDAVAARVIDLSGD